jgi:hypothetical protein
MAGQQRGLVWQQTLARMPVDVSTLRRLFDLEQAIYRVPESLDHRADAVAVRHWLQFATKPGNWKRKRREAKKRGTRK